jgi:hypothetical protein
MGGWLAAQFLPLSVINKILKNANTKLIELDY